MNKSAFHSASLLLLTAALIFGQVGAGFFHNKHDAHEAVADLDHTVLVQHGEHCKICSVDWVHQFVGEDFYFETLKEQREVFLVRDTIEDPNSIILFNSDRAPPVV